MSPSRLRALSLRGKLTLAALAPLCFTLALVWMGAFYLINAWVVGETQKKVRQDLNAAREVLAHEEERVAAVVRFTAHTPALARALAVDRPQTVAEELAVVRRREGLDLLTLTDVDGRVLLRTTGTAAGGAATLPFLDRARLGEHICGPVLLDSAALRREGGDLAERARIFLPPETVADGGGAAETHGMLLACADPVTDGQGQVLGVLYGGLLLNRNLALVDRIRDLVYGEETFDGTAVGSATIFLGKVRVATTIRLKDGERALGTLVSPEVAAAVLGHRQSWVARARVVNDWYLTAYEPILDRQGKAIGALYVGLLEKPFAALKRRAAFSLLALLLLGGGLGYLVARRIARRLSRPLQRLEAAARRVTAGERQIELPIVTGDEVGRLTAAFNRMTISLKEQEEELQSLNRNLELKVTERTALLEEKSLQLIRTQEDLARAERLAAIGSLAAGVAHEINNPAAIIRGNAEILLAGLPPGDPEGEEAEEILRQTERLSRITGNLLAFAREQSGQREPVAVNRLLEEVLIQIGHQADPGRIAIRRRLDPELPLLEADGERLRQVFNNLVLNALQAMAGEGRLTVGSARRGDMLEVTVGDTGPGIPEEILEKIFHPFFTTRDAGSGLGLSVSYGIVRALKGKIEVESELGRGSTFRVLLPLSGA